MDRTHAKTRLAARGTVIEGKMEENKTEKPRQMMLDWMLADSYRKLKEETQQRPRGVATSYIWTCLRRPGKNHRTKSDDCKSFSSWNILSLWNCFVTQLILLVYCKSHCFKYTCRPIILSTILFIASFSSILNSWFMLFYVIYSPGALEKKGENVIKLNRVKV